MGLGRRNFKCSQDKWLLRRIEMVYFLKNKPAIKFKWIHTNKPFVYIRKEIQRAICLSTLTDYVDVRCDL